MSLNACYCLFGLDRSPFLASFDWSGSVGVALSAFRSELWPQNCAVRGWRVILPSGGAMVQLGLPAKVWWLCREEARQ